MAKRRNRLLVPEAREEIDKLKARVMKEKGYSSTEPDQVKFEVANELGVPLNEKYNGTLTSKQAGKVGGEIGGSMVKEMIKMAQQRLSNKQ
jgi:predicted hydrolase (HD superfamily)